MEFVYIWLSKQNISPANFFSLVVTLRFSDISDMMLFNGELRFDSPFNRSRRSSDLPITGVLNVERFLGTFFCYITLLLFLIPLSFSLNHAYPFTQQNTRTLHTHTFTHTHTHTHPHTKHFSRKRTE